MRCNYDSIAIVIGYGSKIYDTTFIISFHQVRYCVIEKHAKHAIYLKVGYNKFANSKYIMTTIVILRHFITTMLDFIFNCMWKNNNGILAAI